MPPRLNLVGQRFGRLLVVDKIGVNEKRNVVWKCICDCGKIKNIISAELRRGRTNSCGCLKNEIQRKLKTKNILNKRFGRLLVIEHVGSDKNNQALWKCVCDCGKTKIVGSWALCRGATRSCGCFRSEFLSGEGNPNWQGGISYEPYCRKFTEKLKEKIREEYGRMCVLCGKSEFLNKQKLDVHHVDYNKEQGCNGKNWKLLPLCHSCHTKTTFNREYYENLLQYVCEV
jgi:hypothetical protein